MQAASHVVYEVDHRVAVITLNRDDRMNAIGGEMEAQLKAALMRAEEDSGIRVVILTGAGRAFCAGKDIADMNPGELLGALPAGAAAHRYAYLTTLSKPLIAAVNGPAAGLGMILAMYCDIRIASSRAFFTTSFSKRGLIAEHGVAWLLPRLVGAGRAMEMLMSARKVGVEEALLMGLVSRVVAPEALNEAARRFARELADTVSPRSLRVIKKQVWDDMERSFTGALQSAREEQQQSVLSADFREGVRHFVEKRLPDFSGE